MTITVLETINECAELKNAWDRLLRQHATATDGIDVTGTIEWTLSLWKNHLRSQPQKIFLLSEAGQVCAILPCHQSKSSKYGIRENILEPITELYPGRKGFLLKDGSDAHLEAVFNFIFTQFSGWDVFRCTLVDGSPSAKMFAAMVEKHRYSVLSNHCITSPYILLPPQQEAYFSGLSKNFRDNLKKSESRLNKAGKMSVRFYQSPDEVMAFLDAVLSIERRSWKEQAGTSITTNPIQEALYRLFLPQAAENQWLMGTVLSVDEKPIAYAMGLIFEGIYYNLKASYDETMRATGAGSFIYSPIIKELYRREIFVCDFMGKCEEFKMRWTDATYSRTTYFLYNQTIRGRMLHTKHRFAQMIKNMRGNADGS